MRSIRLLPIVILTSMMLLGMKGFNLIAGPGHSVGGVETARAQDADEAEQAAAGDETDVAEGETATADVMDADMAEGDMAQGAMAEGEMAEGADDVAMDGEGGGTVQDQIDFPSQTSREALLERLGERRVLMEEREQDLRVREQLLAAAERRLEERLAELEALEARVSAVADAEEQRESEEIGRLVQVYSAMRAKDAAAIFDLLDLPILMEVANAMNPRKMADILGEMNTESARRLTIALAGMPVQMPAETSEASNELPRIDGVPIQ
ncbi:MAG: MotE family protein [Hyphomicrobiales bacterium]